MFRGPLNGRAVGKDEIGRSINRGLFIADREIIGRFGNQSTGLSVFLLAVATPRERWTR